MPGVAEAFGCELSPKSKCLESYRKINFSIGETQIEPRVEYSSYGKKQIKPTETIRHNEGQK